MRGQQRWGRTERTGVDATELRGRGVGVAGEDEAWEEEAERVLERRGGEVKPVDLKEVGVVEAVAEETAAAEGEEIEGEVVERGRERDGLRGRGCGTWGEWRGAEEGGEPGPARGRG